MGWAGIEEEFRVQLHRLCSPPIGAHRFDDLQHRPTQCHRGLHVEQGRDWQVAQRQRGEHFPVQLVVEEGRIFFKVGLNLLAQSTDIGFGPIVYDVGELFPLRGMGRQMLLFLRKRH